MARILIVEDEENISALERDYLLSKGYEVDIANDGEKGLSDAMTGKYDLIILDIMLPEISGLDLLKKIKEAFDIPIIIVSAMKADEYKLRGFDFGADDYMTKPFSPAEMLVRVDRHLKIYKKLNENQLDENDYVNVRGLYINRMTREVKVNGVVKNLTHKEFDLLYFLAKNPNVVFSKADLFEKIWDFDSIGDVSTVTVHIKKLREKIEDPNSDNKYIETIWGVGYKFKG